MDDKTKLSIQVSFWVTVLLCTGEIGTLPQISQCADLALQLIDTRLPLLFWGGYVGGKQ